MQTGVSSSLSSLVAVDEKNSLVTPRVTGFGVSEATGENGAPLNLDLERDGKLNLVVNREAFVSQVFNGLTVAGGEHKGKRLTKELISDEIAAGKKLLLKEDLFEDGVSEEYRRYQLNISKMFSVADAKRKELKDPVNKISRAFQGLLEDTLGELIEIRSEVMARTKAYKVESELKEREAVAADNAWREATADEIFSIAALPGKTAGYTLRQIKEEIERLKRLEGNIFVPHPDQADRYNEAVLSAKEALGSIYSMKESEDAAAKLKEAEEKKKAEADKAELNRLRSAAAEQKEKETVSLYVRGANAALAQCIGESAETIAAIVSKTEKTLINAKDELGDSFDVVFFSGINTKMEALLADAVAKEDAESAAAKDAERAAAEDAERAAAEDAEAREAKTKEWADHELLINSGFSFDGEFYTKDNYRYSRKFFLPLSQEEVKETIEIVNREIKREEDARLEEELKRDNDGAKRRYELRIKEMREGVKACGDTDAVVIALIENRIPHVHFSSE